MCCPDYLCLIFIMGPRRATYIFAQDRLLTSLLVLLDDLLNSALRYFEV
jgi:hypothetical protein